MTTSLRWWVLLLGEAAVVACAFLVGRALAGGADLPATRSPATDDSQGTHDTPTVEPGEHEASPCDPGILEAARERIEELQAELTRPQRRLEAIYEEHPDLNAEIPSYAAEEDPSLYEPERIRANMEELYQTCGRTSDWLGFDCSIGICRAVALQNEARWSDCEAYANWEELYSRWSTSNSFAVECEDGRTLPVILWGPSRQPGHERGPEPPDCEGLEAAECEEAIEDYWEASWARTESGRREDEEIARGMGCSHGD